MDDSYKLDMLPTADPLDVIEAAQQLVHRYPDMTSVVDVVVMAYLEALASLLDDRQILEVKR